jgi:hypothetical protein
MINRSIIDPQYADGQFYSGSGLGRDSKYKVKQVLQLLIRQEFPLSECLISKGVYMVSPYLLPRSLRELA